MIKYKYHIIIHHSFHTYTENNKTIITNYFQTITCNNKNNSNIYTFETYMFHESYILLQSIFIGKCILHLLNIEIFHTFLL